MEKRTEYTMEELPLWGLRKISFADVEEAGNFVSLPKSGFFICREGSITVADRERFYTIMPDDMIILPIQATVYIKHCSPDIRGTVGIADMEKVMEIASRTVEASHGLGILSNPKITLSQDELERINEIASIVQKRIDEGDSDSLPTMTLWNALCYEIALVYKKKCCDTKTAAGRNDAVLLSFLFSLKDNLRKCREVQFYAEEQCLSPRYFSTLIKESTGMTPLEIITKATMRAAKEMLDDTSLTVKEISYKLNFPSPSSFGRWFKHYEGITPAEYRK